jgi:hypothetical protein
VTDSDIEMHSLNRPSPLQQVSSRQSDGLTDRPIDGPASLDVSACLVPGGLSEQQMSGSLADSALDSLVGHVDALMKRPSTLRCMFDGQINDCLSPRHAIRNGKEVGLTFSVRVHSPATVARAPASVSVRPSVCLSVRLSVRPSIRPCRSVGLSAADPLGFPAGPAPHRLLAVVLMSRERGVDPLPHWASGRRGPKSIAEPEPEPENRRQEECRRLSSWPRRICRNAQAGSWRGAT